MALAAPAQALAAAEAPNPHRRKRDNISAIKFIAPFGVLFLVMFVAPIGYALYQSLFTTKRSGLGLGGKETVWAGLSNYAKIFEDSTFLSAVERMLLLGVVQVPTMLGLALLIALLLDSGSARFRSVSRLVDFLPYALSGIIAALIWSYLYTPGITPLETFFGWFGLHFHFTDPNVVLWSIGNIVTWTYAGYNMLVMYSALQAIPRDLYEAARIDGASALSVAVRIKIPLVFPSIVLTTIFSIIGTLQLYSEPYLLQRISAAVDNRYTPLMLINTVGLNNSNYNLAAAMSVFLALIIGALSFGLLKFSQRKAGV